jgi:hypothetical protein
MLVRHIPTFDQVEEGVCAMLGCTREEFNALPLDDRVDLVWEWTATLPWEEFASFEVQ